MIGVFAVSYITYFIAWEKLTQRNDDLTDSIVDTFFVSLGAALLVSIWVHSQVSILLFVGSLTALYVGVVNRIDVK